MDKPDILYMDKDIIVCLKPPKVLSTDEPGGLPELLRREIGDDGADIRTVHRLDRATSGLMLLARNPAAASELSRQIREEGIGKEYLAVVHGDCPDRGSMRDLMYRDKARKMSYVTDKTGKGVQEAMQDYETLACPWWGRGSTASPRTTAPWPCFPTASASGTRGAGSR